MTKFYGGLDDKQCFIVHGISLNNTKQVSEEYRQQYINLIKKHQKNLSGHLELLGDEIYSLYQDNVEKTKSIALQCKKFIEQSNFSICCQWESLSSTDEYKKLLIQITKDYKQNNNFTTIVNELVKKHAFKKNEDAALNYILHECAGFLSLPSFIRKQQKLEKNIAIVFIYPSREFNPAVMYQIKKNNSELKYKGYQLKPPDKEKIMTQCLSLKTTLNNHGILEEEQGDFIKDIFKIIKDYQSHKGKCNYDNDNSIKNGFFNDCKF